MSSYGSDDTFNCIFFYCCFETNRENFHSSYPFSPIFSLSAYEGLKRGLEVPAGETGGINTWKLLFAGGVAGTLSWASIYPLGETLFPIAFLCGNNAMWQNRFC